MAWEIPGSLASEYQSEYRQINEALCPPRLQSATPCPTGGRMTGVFALHNSVTAPKSLLPEGGRALYRAAHMERTDRPTNGIGVPILLKVKNRVVSRL